MSVRERLTPTPAQERVLVEFMGQSRFIWNRMLTLMLAGEKIETPDGGTYYEPLLSFRELTQMLAVMRQEYAWLGAGGSAAQQKVLRNLTEAFSRHSKNPDHFRIPTLKKKGRGGDFVYLRDLKVRRLNRKWGEAFVPKLGWVKFRVSRPWRAIASAKSATIKRSTGGAWHVTFTIPDRPEFKSEHSGTSAGIDLGGRRTVTVNTAAGDGVAGDSWWGTVPGLTEMEQARFLRLQRQLERQERGSNRYRATQAKMGRLTDKLSRRRKHWVEKTTTRLAREHDVIVLERLRPSAMAKRPHPVPDLEHPGQWLPNGAAAKSGLNRLIYASQWGRIRERLTDKVRRAGTTLVLINPAYTSQQCSECLAPPRKGNRESQAVFRCLDCGYESNADDNAARNIHRIGLYWLEWWRGRKPEIAAGHAVDDSGWVVDGRDTDTVGRQPATRQRGTADAHA